MNCIATNRRGLALCETFHWSRLVRPTLISAIFLAAHSATVCCIVPHCTVLCCIVAHFAVLYRIVLPCTVLYHILRPSLISAIFLPFKPQILAWVINNIYIKKQNTYSRISFFADCFCRYIIIIWSGIGGRVGGGQVASLSSSIGENASSDGPTCPS